MYVYIYNISYMYDNQYQRRSDCDIFQHAIEVVCIGYSPFNIKYGVDQPVDEE